MQSNTRFVLPVQGNIDKIKPGEIVEVQTRGLLSSMGGAYLIVVLCGVENTNVGVFGCPVVFRCLGEELECIRELLEDALQEPGFDRDCSALYVV